jgi:hypothetical protein
MRAALVALLTTAILILGLTPAHAQEIPECNAPLPGVEICALVQGENVIIMLNGEEILEVKVDFPPPATVPPLDNPGGGDDDPPPGRSVETPRPAVTVTRIPAPATVVVPGPTGTRTVTVRPTATLGSDAATVTITPEDDGSLLVSGEDLPPGVVTVERAITFGAGLLLLLMVMAALGLMAAYGMGYRHAEKQEVNKLTKLRADLFGGKHR